MEQRHLVTRSPSAHFTICEHSRAEDMDSQEVGTGQACQAGPSWSRAVR